MFDRADIVSETNAIGVAKDVLKTRLEWIIASCPQANPSRTTLKRVNDFLLSPFADPLMLGISSRPDGTQGLDTSPMIYESQ